jgi:8-oxo-dGTP pyrophosphatase MutT (NUDIX family)
MNIPQKFHIAVKAIIVKGDKALVLKEESRYNGYDLSGGKIDENESIEEALKRELNEEIGLKEFTTGNLVHVYERKDYKKEGFSLMLVFYQVFASDFEITLSEEHNEYKWISKQDILEMAKNNLFRNDGVKVALEMILK